MTGRDGTVLAVFAKSPQPGAAKTRLIPLLGADGAAALHARLVEHALATARASSLPRIELHCAPGSDDPFFLHCKSQYGVTLRDQVPGDLGLRMQHAFDIMLDSCSRAILVGSDCPALTPHHLREAEGALRDGADAVFVPCEDGGYALIGITRVDSRLFDGVAWGTDLVMAATRLRLKELGWTWRELETLWDVDRPEDYQRLVAARLLEKYGEFKEERLRLQVIRPGCSSTG